MTKRLLFWIAWYVPLVGLWLLFVVTLARPELLLGIVAAAVGAFYGLILGLAFLVLQSPDVALSQITVGAVALPLMILLALAKVRREEAGRWVFLVAAAGFAALML